MTTREQEENKTKVAAVIFGGVLAAVAGPIGIWVAASAVAIQQALFPNVGENAERREERQHEAELDKEARRANRLARHRARLDAIAAQDQAYRQRYRDYLANGGDQPYRYALDKNGQPIMVDGKPKRAGFWDRLKQRARKGAAHVVLGAARAHDGYVAEKAAAEKRREAGEPVVKPAVAGLYGAALGYLGFHPTRPSETTDAAKATEPAKPAAGPTPATDIPVGKTEYQSFDPTGRTAEIPDHADENLQPAARPEPEATPAATAPTEPAAADPQLREAVDWYASGGSGVPEPTGEGARQRDEFLAYADKQAEAYVEGNGPAGRLDTTNPAERAEETENNNGGPQMGETATVQAPVVPTGEANIELVDTDLEEAGRGFDEVNEAMAQVNAALEAASAARKRAEGRIAAAKQRGEVQGAKAQVAAAIEAYEGACRATGELLDQMADASVAAAANTAQALDAGGAARRSLEPTLKALDDLRADGGSGDMAATAKAD